MPVAEVAELLVQELLAQVAQAEAVVDPMVTVMPVAQELPIEVVEVAEVLAVAAQVGLEVQVLL